MKKYKIITKKHELFIPQPYTAKLGDIIQTTEGIGEFLIKHNIAEPYTEPTPMPEAPTATETIATRHSKEPDQPDEGADDAEPDEPDQPDEGATDEPKIKTKNKGKYAANAE